jgi:HJR/Mrr/RecB family endonuclease
MSHSERRTTVTPIAYEEMVATHFRARGYAVELTPKTKDYGVDAFARKEGQQLALQARTSGCCLPPLFSAWE